MRPKILVIDVGGSHIKCLLSGETTRRKFASGPDLTPQQMVDGVLKMVADWHFDVISIGYPGVVRHGAPAREPHHLAPGWVGFDFEAAFGRPVRIVNDAAMQALGSYQGGKMLFLGLGTGLGSALIVDGQMVAMELGHLRRSKHHDYEDLLGKRGYKRLGKKKWRRKVHAVVKGFSCGLAARRDRRRRRPGRPAQETAAAGPARRQRGRVSRRLSPVGRIAAAQVPEHLQGPLMKPTSALHQLGQSLWLDNITRTLLRSGTLARYIRDLSVTGLTSNPTIFEHAIGAGDSYDASIRVLADAGLSEEDLFFELALEDLTEAADLFRPAFEASDGVDGWVSLEVSPLLADNAAHTIQAANRLHAKADKPNLFIKIPGTAQGLEAIEQVIFDGVPVNVTLLFSREHVLAAAEAYLRGLERRLAAGLDLKVASVLSLFVSRWDVGVQEEVASPFHNRLGIAIAMRTYKAHCELLASERWQRLAAAGAQPQRLLWASTGTKDPAAPDTLYVEALAAPGTINTLPEKTLLAFADHGQVERRCLPTAATPRP